jgi:hypothetical protein
MSRSNGLKFFFWQLTKQYAFFYFISVQNYIKLFKFTPKIFDRFFYSIKFEKKIFGFLFSYINCLLLDNVILPYIIKFGIAPF